MKKLVRVEPLQEKNYPFLDKRTSAGFMEAAALGSVIFLELRKVSKFKEKFYHSQDSLNFLGTKPEESFNSRCSRFNFYYHFF